MKQFGYLFYNPHCRWKETPHILKWKFQKKRRRRISVQKEDQVKKGNQK
jgi:hypothetical protein